MNITKYSMNTMMNRIWVACVGLMLCIGSAMAQVLNVTGKVKGEMPAGMRLYVMPAERLWDNPDSVKFADGKLQATTTVSSCQVYKLVGATSQRQIIKPFGLKVKDGKATLDISFTPDGDVEIVNADADTKALTAFNDIYTDRAKRIWMEGKNLQNEALQKLVLGYTSAADSIVKRHCPSASVNQYLHLWAASLTFENIETLKFITGKEPSAVGIDTKTELSKLLSTMDCDMSSAFEAAPRLALATIPNGTIAERITTLESKVKTAALKVRAEDVMLSKHIASFNYADNYEAGLKDLTALTNRFHLDTKYLNEFKVRKSSIAGTPFPDGINLYDLKGNKVDFAKYRGKYVYVDMWASWCVPCIKEIPYLKTLEKELQNDNVCFLSLSIDTNEAAWKKKVADLGLEGELVVNKDNKLCEALNVTGIPFFLIYDKEGKLYKYNTYRPSDARLKPLLEGLK